MLLLDYPLKIIILYYWASLVAQRVKRLPTMRETQVQSLGWEDPLEKEMATHCSTLAGKSHGLNTGASLSLLQGIFLTQGSNPGLPHCRRILYQLSHNGSPRILQWVAYPFSSR